MGAYCRRSLRIRCHSAPKEAIHRKGEMVIDQERKRQIREIYERQTDRAYRIAMIYTGDPHDAEDVAESVFLTMIEKKISWHGKVQLIAPSEVNSEDGGFDAGDDACADIENEAENEAARLLLMLPEDQREAVYLCYYEGYTVKETAAIMGLKETKVRSALTAAKRRLRRKSDE